MNLDFEKCIEEVSESFRLAKSMVLATSKDNRVTARSLSFVSDGCTLYFQTDTSFIKVEQIRANPNVAVSFGNCQIEGIAEELGHPLEKRNSRFIELFKEKHPGSYAAYSSLPTEVVFRVIPKMITLWKYVEGNPVRDFIDMAGEKTWRESYL